MLVAWMSRRHVDEQIADIGLTALDCERVETFYPPSRCLRRYSRRPSASRTRVLSTTVSPEILSMFCFVDFLAKRGSAEGAYAPSARGMESVLSFVEGVFPIPLQGGRERA